MIILQILLRPDCVRWLKNGKYHNQYGPVMFFGSGSTFWAVNDKIHRLTGPAKIWADGSIEYWINGIEYTYFEYLIEKETIAQQNYIPNLQND